MLPGIKPTVSILRFQSFCSFPCVPPPSYRDPGPGITPESCLSAPPHCQPIPQSCWLRLHRAPRILQAVLSPAGATMAPLLPPPSMASQSVQRRNQCSDAPCEILPGFRHCPPRVRRPRRVGLCAVHRISVFLTWDTCTAALQA